MRKRETDLEKEILRKNIETQAREEERQAGEEEGEIREILIYIYVKLTCCHNTKECTQKRRHDFDAKCCDHTSSLLMRMGWNVISETVLVLLE